MVSTLIQRLALPGPLSEQYLQDVTPIVQEWTARAVALSEWVGDHATASTFPVTVLISPLKPVDPQ